ncbi:Ohr family peroxiredoxin [Calidifontibacter sp. DB0510]|uniref:Ohr family peroxiredoxin n=1 Tax=Metallococcus carri TaxID=1656884 RepID=A0A967B3U7_9MICO|nr:Ohr family peroxiredoxin [Metallococcus carri]NHN55137.1 Ohr family peroxiredoxin [Metallococcus carri]NOP36214.1 Ohr family peroxiredoxin [Calidifontibacter sp. DB2511S]
MPHESLNETLYTIAATSQGGRDGRVKSEDGVVDLALGKPGSASNPKANPETLFAAGYSACFGGALAKVAEAEGIDASQAPVTAAATLGKTDSGFGLAVEITAQIAGVDAETAQRLAEKAHEVCPYSKATRGNIDVTVKGVPA